MGLFQVLVDKYKVAKKKSLNKKVFIQALMEAVGDGKLSNNEIDELEKRKIELELSEDDIRSVKTEAYLAAFNAAKKDSQVTSEEEKELSKIQEYLGLEDGEIDHSKKELSRLRLLNEIQQGNMPIVFSIAHLVIQKGEKVHWVEPAILAEEKVVSRRYEGGSQGVSLRIMKGVSYRVGSHRGHLVSEVGVVAVSEGELVLTNNRLVFRGDKKSLSVKLGNILDIQLCASGLQFSELNKSKPKLVKFKEKGNCDIIGAILSYTINHFSEK